jgi:hypothetical protein
MDGGSGASEFIALVMRGKNPHLTTKRQRMVSFDLLDLLVIKKSGKSIDRNKQSL